MNELAPCEIQSVDRFRLLMAGGGGAPPYVPRLEIVLHIVHNRGMKQVPLSDLKEDLSGYAELAAQGTPVEVTRYNQPYVVIYPATRLHLHVGPFMGKRPLASLDEPKLVQAALRILAEDRSE